MYANRCLWVWHTFFTLTLVEVEPEVKGASVKVAEMRKKREYKNKCCGSKNLIRTRVQPKTEEKRKRDNKEKPILICQVP
ncbi:hypothetical protein Pelo_7725 [Pelomyxa schiedti]|nr:hypothetical protein Pelo_7725 [Pelomyxa schiedti]